jgi:hypothetical protein
VVYPTNQGSVGTLNKSTPHPTRDALGLIGYIPEQDQRKPKPVENHWKPEDDLPPEVLKAFEKKEKRK